MFFLAERADIIHRYYGENQIVEGGSMNLLARCRFSIGAPHFVTAFSAIDPAA